MPRTPETLTESESLKLISYLLLHDVPDQAPRIRIRNTLMAELMLDAGLRVGELVQLLATDLVVSDEPVSSICIRAEIAKGKHQRIVPLTERIKANIRQMQKQYWKYAWTDRPIHAFYLNASQYHLSPRQVQRIIKRAALRSIGRIICPHVLRHTFATRLMQVTNSRVVQEMLGHRHLSTTQIYTHPNHTDKVDAVNKMQGLTGKDSL